MSKIVNADNIYLPTLYTQNVAPKDNLIKHIPYLPSDSLGILHSCLCN